MTSRILSSVFALSLVASSIAPAFAAEADTSVDISVQAPSALPCEGTTGSGRARCITDALKTWKEIEHDYFQEERRVIAQWKKDHANMGIGTDYQTALREFLSNIQAQRKEFRTQLQTFRKAFFDEQNTKRMQGDGGAAAERSQPKKTVQEADSICGSSTSRTYRVCMRMQLRTDLGSGIRTRTAP